jgi:hypothetical protein
MPIPMAPLRLSEWNVRHPRHEGALTRRRLIAYHALLLADSSPAIWGNQTHNDAVAPPLKMLNHVPGANQGISDSFRPAPTHHKRLNDQGFVIKSRFA